MNKEQLLKRLADCAANDNTEMAHAEADDALLQFINDMDISAAYEAFEKWYS